MTFEAIKALQALEMFMLTVCDRPYQTRTAIPLTHLPNLDWHTRTYNLTATS